MKLFVETFTFKNLTENWAKRKYIEAIFKRLNMVHYYQANCLELDAVLCECQRTFKKKIKIDKSRLV